MTLIEVMIALAITSVGMLGSLAVIGSLITGTVAARSITEASVLAQSKIEECVAQMPVTVIPQVPPNGAITETNLNGLGIVQTSPPGAYTRTTTWGISTDGLRRTIQVQVTWTDGNAKTHSVVTSRERFP